MTNNIKQALQSAIEALEANPVIDKYGVLKIQALAECKSALAELENAEPVAEIEPIGYMSNLAIQRLSQRGLSSVMLKKTKTCFNPVYYTSPQPREWVGLSDEDISDIHVAIGEEIPLGTISLVSEKLKQLNMKG